MDMLCALVIPAAVVMDALWGDPRALPHPIRWMGRSIQVCEPFFRKRVRNPYMAGALFALFLIAGCWGAALLLSGMAHRYHPLAGFGMETAMVFFSLSARSLWDAAAQIHQLLTQGQVDGARTQLDMIVGRDVGHYEEDQIARATVETVAENFVDGVLAPLFFTVIGGGPLAMAYKMVNTLDSMVGYKNTRYRQFGWAAARMDDWANFIPARLSVGIIALTAGLLQGPKGVRSLATAVREGSHHPSPNAGYPEAAFAGALGVRLNGPNIYQGKRVDKPHIGVAFGDANRHHIQNACRLLALSTLVSSAMAWGGTAIRCCV